MNVRRLDDRLAAVEQYPLPSGSTTVVAQLNDHAPECRLTNIGRLLVLAGIQHLTFADRALVMTVRLAVRGDTTQLLQAATEPAGSQGFRERLGSCGVQDQRKQIGIELRTGNVAQDVAVTARRAQRIAAPGQWQQMPEAGFTSAQPAGQMEERKVWIAMVSAVLRTLESSFV